MNRKSKTYFLHQRWVKYFLISTVKAYPSKRTEHTIFK